MPILSGPSLALMSLVALAGVYKVVDPGPTSGALRLSGLPHRHGVVRALGSLEVVIVTAWLVDGGPVTAFLGALAYLGFALFVVNALAKKIPLSSCGCFGSIDTPPSSTHVIVNLTGFSVMVIAAVFPLGPLAGLVGAEISLLVPHLAFTGATVFLLYGLLAVLPQLATAEREAPVSLSGRRST